MAHSLNPARKETGPGTFSNGLDIAVGMKGDCEAVMYSGETINRAHSQLNLNLFVAFDNIKNCRSSLSPIVDQLTLATEIAALIAISLGARRVSAANAVDETNSKEKSYIAACMAISLNEFNLIA